METFGVIFGISMMLLVYFLPSIVAHVRGHANFSPILALNILTGWTAIGWVVAFVWSLTEQK